MTHEQPTSIAVLTSGGDAPGMNAAVRAVTRAALHAGVEIFAVYEGYEGLIRGGRHIRPLRSEDVGGIVQEGGTIIGSARSKEFREREGRRRAARNLVEHGIDGLVVIGGDGSLTGADLFRSEWPELLDELVEAGELDEERAAAHRHLRLVGLVGSIDNDMFGTDMTIGADSALHRITDAIDAIHSTAASHQRTFVVEVMGRHCGYLALMSAIATGANWVLIPEHPPDADDWEAVMCDSLRAGREIGRRQNIVVVAEGAQDRNGKPISAEHVKDVLEERLGEDTRITILGHVQRGGRPSAFDRYMSTQLGAVAVERLLSLRADEEAQVIGLREHEVVSSPLMASIEKTHAVAGHIQRQDYDRAMEMRGGSFAEAFETFITLTRAKPRRSGDDGGRRFMVLHAGGPAPGMNTAVRVAVRMAADRGHDVVGALKGFEGLRDGKVQELDWMSVSAWAARGGAELGTSRWKPGPEHLERLAWTLESSRVDGLLVIGGFTAYEVAYDLHEAAEEHPAFDIPIVCLPTTINNDVPGTEVSIGSDTALNAIVADVDRIKQSAVASRRCFVVEVMGNECGYLPLLSGLSTGAERVYLPEEGITLDSLRRDIEHLSDGFRRGKRLGLVIRGEGADPTYTTPFMHALYEKEGGDLYDVRHSVLGHVQQGGSPSPFDRIQATRLATRCVEFLEEQAGRRTPASAFIGLQGGKVTFTDLGRFWELIEDGGRRPAEQRWMRMRHLAQVMSGFPGS